MYFFSVLCSVYHKVCVCMCKYIWNASVLQKYKKVITVQGKQLKVLKLGGRVVLNIILFSLCVLQKSRAGRLKAVIENYF